MTDGPQDPYATRPYPERTGADPGPTRVDPGRTRVDPGRTRVDPDRQAGFPAGAPAGPPAGAPTGPPPGYAQAGYPPPGYAQAAPGPYGFPRGYPYGYPPRQNTNTLAILALVFAFVCAPAAIVMGALARGQIRRTGEEGWGLATAGLVLGIVFTVFAAIWTVIVITAFAGAVHHINQLNQHHGSAAMLLGAARTLLRI